MKCRFCKTPLKSVFIDLVNSPASNSFLSKEETNEPETYYPLKVHTCSKCFLVQVGEDYKKADAIFNKEYAYFSSYSSSWLAHSKKYTESIIERFGYDSSSQVIELASNDGYLLQYFKAKNIPVLGIEPTENTATVAQQKGIDTIVDFFGVQLAKKLADKGLKADLLIANNVLAHVPDTLDFVAGMKILLKKNGVVTIEFPHLMQLMENNQFDTIYHEHFSYFSFHTVRQIFQSQGLVLFDVEELPTHGGSLRIYGKHVHDETKPISTRVQALLKKEKKKGMRTLRYYSHFQERALNIKLETLSFLLKQKRQGKKVAAYGAAAKGNTLLNYCGVRSDLIEYIVDANPHKQNKFAPASHIPVVNEKHLKVKKPDYVIILPWNIKDEIIDQLSYVRKWGGKFVIFIPKTRIIK